jgi:NAD(P)-dependent dehydrogenase (short-subunit alcohol dehydrogenase family)
VRGILVTGGTRGIGLAIADAFRALGDNVVALTSADGDLADPAAAAHVVSSAIDVLGSVDVLVNNAAVILPSPIASVSYSDWQAAWQRTLAVNVFGLANISYCVAQHMIPRRSGRIINIAPEAPSEESQTCPPTEPQKQQCTHWANHWQFPLRPTESESHRWRQVSSRPTGWHPC